MNFEDEKDYIMRIIKEMIRALMSFALGKRYVAVEVGPEEKYEVSGCKLKDLMVLVDSGNIDEAENRLLDDIDYNDNDEVAAAVLFYQYLSEKDEAFLKEHDFSMEEVMDGLKMIAQNAGYGSLISAMIDFPLQEK